MKSQMVEISVCGFECCMLDAKKVLRLLPPADPPAIHDAPVAAPRSRPSASSSVPPPPTLHGDGSRPNPAGRAGPAPRRGRAPLVSLWIRLVSRWIRYVV